jgi:hypothetical protein
MNAKVKTEVEKLRDENAVLRLRAHAAETAMYSVEETLRKTLLEGFIQPIVRRFHELAKQFPIDGEKSTDGVQRIAIDAVKAQRPELAKLSDAEILRTVFGHADTTNSDSK